MGERTSCSCFFWWGNHCPDSFGNALCSQIWIQYNKCKNIPLSPFFRSEVSCGWCDRESCTSALWSVLEGQSFLGLSKSVQRQEPAPPTHSPQGYFGHWRPWKFVPITSLSVMKKFLSRLAWEGECVFCTFLTRVRISLFISLEIIYFTFIIWIQLKITCSCNCYGLFLTELPSSQSVWDFPLQFQEQVVSGKFLQTPQCRVALGG